MNREDFFYQTWMSGASQRTGQWNQSEPKWTTETWDKSNCKKQKVIIKENSGCWKPSLVGKVQYKTYSIFDWEEETKYITITIPGFHEEVYNLDDLLIDIWIDSPTIKDIFQYLINTAQFPYPYEESNFQF